MDTTLDKLTVQLTVNGRLERREVQPRQHLIDFLREDLGLKGSHVGCEHGVCGACSVMLNGKLVRGCLVLAVQADGGTVETIEGITKSGVAADLQAAFVRRNALQCGYCTPGMLTAALDLVQSQPTATREEVREWMSSNYCRCTGYQAIVDAICDVLAARAATTTTNTGVAR
ncbi:MAG TPA: (2Fe-2S)-binding protein [Casimicrobium sp.]|nr:(2Fe-2S)-binding protein [Casimicrobium sp.]